MGAVHVHNKYYLSITFLVTLGYQLLFFLIAFTLQIDKLTDFAGGTNFVLLGILTLCFSDARTNARNIVASVLLIVWATRLARFLLFRILRTGVDHHFDEMRRHFVKFGAFWVLQLLWVWSVSLPVIVLNSPGVTKYGQPKFGTGRDVAGVDLFAIGFVMEAVSDAQRFQFREKHGNDGWPCDSWLFSWTRHPSYFGEIIMYFVPIFGAPSLILYLIKDRYIHDFCVSSCVWIHQRRSSCSSLWDNSWTVLSDVLAYVHLWTTFI
jgi:steroid 5-alpha reductase family enzyme